ncbi:hypothetical protein ACFFHJ_41595 [Planotetraspora thailandica]|uniref:hypothetical protein n=1 Tax=Planotetraspora thailandica TaxID=487172 RepID=UPI0019528513|nr:hypothetical protein [Planotetraspora thailandica]
MSVDRGPVTLAEWAETVGRTEDSVRNHWRPLPGFPQPVGRRPSASPGPGVAIYARAELDAWRAQWEVSRDKPAPERLAVPGDPDEYLTLGAIARRLGVDGRTVTQYRSLIDQAAASEQHGQRRRYRLADVIEVLNTRAGRGVSLTPEVDRRRTHD